jgi:CRP/FNR family cyclic AMP-dependent transcriptional regulator
LSLTGKDCAMSQAVRTVHSLGDASAIRGTLAVVQPFASWPSDVIDQLCVRGRIETYSPGEYVYRMNDPAKGMWIVREGWFQVSRTWADGRRAVLDHQQPGQITGIIPTFDGLPAPFDVVARIPASMIFIPKDVLLGVLDARPALMFGIAALLCRRSRLDYARHVILSLNSPRAILAKSILFMIRGQVSFDAAHLEVPVRVPQEDIASLWGMSRQTINREIARFTKEGILAQHYRALVVLDARRLLHAAESEEELDVFERFVLSAEEKVLKTSM